MFCPWSDLTPDTFPNCEEAICAWVRQPANTWSNFGYIIVAFYFFMKANKSSRNARLLQGFGSCILLIGITSFMAHATTAQIFTFLDFISIFVFACFMMVLNLKQIQLVSNSRNLIIVFLSLLLPSVVVLYNFGAIRLPLMLLFSAAFLAIEVKWIIGSKMTKKQKGSLIKIIFSTCIALILLNLDIHRIDCWPDNHYLQWHSLWHLGAATTLLFVGHYLQERQINV